MDKLNMKTENITQENIEKIRGLFPNAVTEVKKDGNVTLAVDFDVLKQELSESLIEAGQERYQMTWPDKRKSVLLANSAISATLRPCKDESVDFDNTKNLYIEGDNLDVLKLLRETYLGKVKMIYIDPPYNTGNDFVYEDDFATESGVWREKSGDYDEQGNRLVRNPDSNGRFHTDWLNMIYPRLKVARDLLSDDGVIFISIDDNEQANLKKICDEVFGESNLIGIFKWNRVAKAPSLSNTIRIKYEYILSYYKEKLSALYGKESYNKQGPLWHLPNKRSELLFPAQSIRIQQSFVKGFYGGTYQVELIDDMICKNGLNENDVRILACSAWGQLKINEYVKNGKTFEIKKSPLTMYTDLSSDGNFIAPSDLISIEECGVKRNTDADEDMKKMKIPFDYSKPISLIWYLLKMVTMFDKNATILDFFSGSATTAHAVMQLNAEDGGNRRFIMVQLPEKCDEKSEAYKAGYKNICEIGKERIRRAGRKILESEELRVKSGVGDNLHAPHSTLHTVDVGFRVLKLDSSNMQDVYYNPAAMAQSLLDTTIDNVKPDRTPMDLLFQVMLELGVQLSAKIEEKEVCGKKYYAVNDNDIIACFDDDINQDVITEIAKQQPLYAVFKDKSFATDSVGINNEQLFKTYSPSTKVKVI